MAETKPKPKPKNLFDLGVQEPTLRVTEKVDADDLAQFISLHLQGVWGSVTPKLEAHNARALKSNGVVVSIRTDRNGTKLFIRTDLAKKETQILLPEDATKKKKKKA